MRGDARGSFDCVAGNGKAAREDTEVCADLDFAGVDDEGAAAAEAAESAAAVGAAALAERAGAADAAAFDFRPFDSTRGSGSGVPAAAAACILALLRMALTLTHLGLGHSSVPSGAVVATYEHGNAVQRMLLSFLCTLNSGT